MASILATLKISKAVGDDGNEITPEPKFLPGLVAYVVFSSSLWVLGLTYEGIMIRQPVPYQCNIKPRNNSAYTLAIQANTS
jgi:hypothetical protein